MHMNVRTTVCKTATTKSTADLNTLEIVILVY